MIPKFNFNQKITESAINRAKDVLSLQGMALPCSVVSVSGSIVTVKFEIISGFTIPNVTIPHFGGEWIRYPVQVGDNGVVVPMDARLNAITGIGEGFADLSKPANLTSLVFMPIANVAWSAVNGDYLTLYGQTGVTIKDSRSGSSIMTIDSSGVHFNCPVFANGKRIDETHKHDGVQAGGAQTGTVV